MPGLQVNQRIETYNKNFFTVNSARSKTELLQGPALCVHLIESQLKRLERRDQLEVFVLVTCPSYRCMS